MKVGIVSDTHGCAATWRDVYSRYFADAELIIHAGDILYHGPRNSIPAEYDPKLLAEELNVCPVPLIMACGNCDAEIDGMVLDMPVQAPYAYIMRDNLRIIVNHGHHLEDDEDKWKMAQKMKAGLIITGHTHIAALEKRDGIIRLNPGSPSAAMSKREDKRGTIGIIENGRVEILDVQTGEILGTANF